MKTKHMEDLQSHLTAHKVAMENLKHEEKSRHLFELETLKAEHRNDQGNQNKVLVLIRNYST